MSDEIRDRERVVVLFHASWCPYSRAALPLVDAAEPEASVPFARVDLGHPMSPLWDAYRIHVVPTLVYFEHGEELERIDAMPGRGLTRHEIEEFLAHVEAIQHEPLLPKRMHGPRRS